MGRRIGYAELDKLVDRAAKGFQALGVKPGVHVGLYLPNCPQFLIAYFGALRAGGTIVPYSPLDAAQTLEHKLADSQTQILVTLDLAALYPQIAAVVAHSGVRKLVIGDLAEFSGRARADPRAAGGRQTDRRGRAGRAQCALSQAHRQRRRLRAAAGARSAPGDRGAAIYRRHDRQAERRDVDARQSDRGRSRNDRGDAARRAQARAEGELRALVVLPLFHIYAMVVLMLLGVRLGAELVLHVRFDPDAVLKDIETQEDQLLPRRADDVCGAAASSRAEAGQPAKPQDLCSSGGAPLAAGSRLGIPEGERRWSAKAGA